MERYKIQRSSELKDGWVCTDTENLVVVTWENHRFNETQKVTLLEDSPTDYMAIARIMREMGDWLAENHRDKVF